ncbi:MAG: LamG domain-containing protein, partial [Deltaproteobacteria bacterium]|nr:LamG domain-containing protein [Deltaproteobacteria bacterium]
GAALTATLHKSDVLRCAATPVDDEGEGATVESEPVTVINTPPSCDAALLTPMTGDVTTVFSCTPEACADADGDPFTTQVIWTLNGEDLPPSTTDEISPVEIGAVRGDTLRCKVFGGDGTADGSPVKSAEVILGNALPQIASAVAGPIPVHEEEVVTCTPSGWEDADGDPAGFVFQWTVNAVVVEGQTSATLSGEFFDKGDVVSCTAIPFDGLDQGAGVDSKVAVTVADTAPAITGVSVTPGTGSKANTFTCEALGWSDPDPADQPDQWAVPDPMDATLPGFVYAWKVNGQVVPDALSQAWQPHSATKGDTLSCAALPHDGELAGEAKTSPGVLLLNAPPTVASVAISPAQGGKNDTFQCVPSGYQDPDVGDPEIYQFQWYVDGVLLAGQELATLSGTAAGLAQGDLLVCSVIPFDGEGWGAPVTSAPREITNSLPSITGVTIQPGTPVSADDLACVPAGWLDTDGDPPGYLFQWSLNQALLGSQTTSTLSHTLTKKGDKVMCVVTPFDGMDQGFTKSSPLVTIGNTPPPPPEVHVSPAFPELGDDLSCVPSGTPADPDGDSVTLAFSWFLDAAPLPGETGATLDGAVAGSCDVVRCEAVASDGSAASAPGWDDVMVDGTPGLGIHSLEQALTVPDSGSLQLTTGKLTVELWVMPMPGATGPLVTKHDPASGFAAGGFELFLDAQGRPGFLVDGGAGAGSAAVADFPLAEGVFTHVAGTYDGASVRLFVQGVLVDAAAATGGISCDEALVVGLDPLTGEATDVIVDEIRINQSPMYATNFTPSTVLSVGPDTRLLLHLDEDGGSTVQDASSWNNDGSCALCHWTLGACAVQAENLPPSKPTVQIVPGTPADGDDLVCNVTVESVDPEGLPVTYGYAWTSTGGDQVSGKVAAAALTAPGEIWTCTVTPFDGALYGPAGTAQVTITGGTINPAGSYALSPPINYKCAF